MNLYNYYSDCYKRDWLYYSETQWTFTPYSSYFSAVRIVDYEGSVGGADELYTYVVRPSLYLKSSVEVINGEGTSENPYILTAQDGNS